jgi:hypothetical protein
MAQAPPPLDPDSNDPYERLGLRPGASFEAVQKAKVERLSALPADDMQARAQVEAAYDALLMQSLKERQLGQLTGAAANASKQEAGSSASSGLAGGRLPRLPSLPAMPKPQITIGMPQLNLAEGEQLWQPLAAQGLLLVTLLLIGQQAGLPELLLSLAALITIANLQRRSRKFFRAVGLTVLALVVGTLLGGLASSGLAGSGLPITAAQLAALPTLILLTALSVLID